MKRFRSLAVAAASCAVIFTLGACTMLAPGQGSTRTQQSDATPEPTPTASPIAEDPGLAVSPGDELLTFAATAQTDYGAKLTITLIVHQPVEWDSPAGGLMINYLETRHLSTSMVDTRWDKENNVSLGVVDVEVVASGESWREGSGVQLLLGPGITKDVVLNLPGRDVNGRFSVAGEGIGHAIVAFPAFDGRPDVASWAEAVQTWGMTPDAGLPDQSELVPSLGNCSVTFTDRAKTASWVAAWSTPTNDQCFAGIAG